MKETADNTADFPAEMSNPIASLPKGPPRPEAAGVGAGLEGTRESRADGICGRTPKLGSKVDGGQSNCTQ